MTAERLGLTVFLCIDQHGSARATEDSASPVVTSVEEPVTKPKQLDCEQHSGWYQYAIIRADLPHGVQIAQTIHAINESTPHRLPPNSAAVALAARDRVHLMEIKAMLDAKGIPHTLISECDGEPMAIGIEPTQDRTAIRKALSALPLAR